MKKISLLSLIFSMAIFGTIGIFRSYIPFPSAFLAMARGFIGAAFIFVFLIVTKKGVDFSAIKKNAPILFITGAFIGINWILLFEAYKYTTVAIATLCYYMAPLFVTLASSLFFGEKLTARKIICISTAICGMILVSGVTDGAMPHGSALLGILLGLGAAVFYASVTLLSKKVKDISSFDMTFVQLLSAAIVVMPYSLIFEDISFSDAKLSSLWLILLVGILHTGIAYVLYFTSVKNLEASKVAIFSYLDPIIAIILSALVLKEKMTPASCIGAALILISAFVNEAKFLTFKKRSEK